MDRVPVSPLRLKIHAAIVSLGGTATAKQIGGEIGKRDFDVNSILWQMRKINMVERSDRKFLNKRGAASVFWMALPEDKWVVR